MTGIIPISGWQLGLAALLSLATSFLYYAEHRALQRQLLIAMARMAAQLTLIGFVLTFLFAQMSGTWVAVAMLVMFAVATRECLARNPYRFRDASGWWIGALAVGSTNLLVVLLALNVVIQPDPWFHPQYAIPVFGMLIGNSLNTISVGMTRVSDALANNTAMVEQRLMLGMGPAEAVRPLTQRALHDGVIPIMNNMAAAGIVSLPGMMTGQILSGTEPSLAIRYQILIFLLIFVSAVAGAFIAVHLTARRLFDGRDRFCPERLTRRR